jgi:hypothetical protein
MTKQSRPQNTIVLAMSADGKIADVNRYRAKFGCKNYVKDCRFLTKLAPRLNLMEVRTENQEVFLDYSLQQFPD